MRQRGFTLIELLIVIAIGGILVSLAVLQFGRMTRKGGIEREIHEFHSDLAGARSCAFFGKKGAAVTVTANGFALYSTSTVAGTPVRRKTFPYPVTLAVESPNAAAATVTIFFDSQGMAGFGTGTTPDPALTAATVCAGDAGSGAAVDSVVTAATMITVGKNNATGCSSANITAK